MNERQAQHFLWVWSRRRRRGPLGFALLGLAVGALGGLAFALLFKLLIGMSGAVTVDRTGLAPFFLWTLDAFGPFGMTLAMAAPPFAVFAAGLAYSLYARQERQYTALLARGLTVPDAKPILQFGDFAPMIVVFALALPAMAFLLFMAIQEARPG